MLTKQVSPMMITIELNNKITITNGQTQQIFKCNEIERIFTSKHFIIILFPNLQAISLKRWFLKW